MSFERVYSRCKLRMRETEACRLINEVGMCRLAKIRLNVLGQTQ